MAADRLGDTVLAENLPLLSRTSCLLDKDSDEVVVALPSLTVVTFGAFLVVLVIIDELWAWSLGVA